MATLEKPRFQPAPCNQEDLDITLTNVHLSPQEQKRWIPVISCPADFPAELFEPAILKLVHHPEYNSTLILRAEVVSQTTDEFPQLVPQIQGFRQVQNIHRRLLPRRPGRDAGLEQHCTLYAKTATNYHEEPPATLVILTPILSPDGTLPYYHPTVFHIAFRYETGEKSMLRISVVPFDGTLMDTSSRLYRTCLALLETIHRYGWGILTSYKKRVEHDRIISRNIYQDLYLVMRERHKHLVGKWVESTDPLKHVFEDIGIATYLMLLWKDTFQEKDKTATSVEDEDLTSAPWFSWPRPSAGFLDMGCGNGLLVHILAAEGYAGFGIDIRARHSWTTYPQETQSRLRVHALDPTNVLTYTDDVVPPGVFIIANHADELSPWTPVLSTVKQASGYLSLPCCAWSFDARFQRGIDDHFLNMDNESPDFVDSLALGGESIASSYAGYRIWLARLSRTCGWKIECDTLRIPSTRNWAIIGRAMDNKGSGVETAMRIVDAVKTRGAFKTRKPEGKAGDH